MAPPYRKPQGTHDSRKPSPKDLSHHFSRMAKERGPSSASTFETAISTASFNLGLGLPFAGNFPFDSLEGTIAQPNRFPLFPISPLSPPSGSPSRFTVPKYSSPTPGSVDPSVEIDLATALQYQPSSGYPSLAAFINDFAITHQNQGRIPYQDPQTLITGGAMDGFGKCLMTFADPGDHILMEEFAYLSAKDFVGPYGVGIVPVKLDEQGLDPWSLKAVLEAWDEKSMGRKPHMMYTVTIGQNPMGGIQSIARKQEIYAICQKHDILIFEDDPYWYLQYDLPETNEADFLSRLAPSYVTIDTDGRALAIQTFTKTVAPGCRVGWIVAQPAFIEKLTFATDGSTSNPSGFAEAVLAQLLLREWGINGFTRWLEGLRVNYKGRRDLLCETLAEGRDIFVSGSRSGAKVRSIEADVVEEHLKPHNGHRKRKAPVDNENPEHSSSKRSKVRLYDFRVPPASFYVWISINIAEHPLAQAARPGKPQLSEADIILRLWNHLVSPPYGLLTMPGTVFAATPAVLAKDHFLRLTYAALPVTELRKVGLLFAEALKTFWEGEGWDIPEGVVGGEEEQGRLESLIKHHVRSRPDASLRC